MTKDLFSVYSPPISNSVPVETPVSVDDVWELLTDPRLKELTDTMRSYLPDNEEEYKRLKKTGLGYSTFGGVFDYRSSKREPKDKDGNRIKLENGELAKGLLSPSGLLTIDLDHISQTSPVPLGELKTLLSEDEQIGARLLFVSPSGDGMKVICKTSATITDQDSYKAVWESLKYYIEDKYKIVVDKQGSDIARACLLCYDPEPIILDWDCKFSPELHPLPKKETPRQKTRDNTYYQTHYPDDDGVEEIVRRVELSGIDIAPDRGDYIKLVYSFSALGERGRSLLHRVCSMSAKYNRENTDTDWNSIQSQANDQSIGTFINMAKANGIDVSRPVEYPQYTPQVGGSSVLAPVETREEETKEEQEFKQYLEIPDLGGLAKEKREGVKTKYKFKTKDLKREESLVLRSGAITLICGKSSHCKSKLLQNIALQIAEDKEEEGSVLFFTYEEELSDVLFQFANIHSNVSQLSQYGTPNTEVIQDYYRTGDLPRCTQNKKSEILPKLAEFKNLYQSGDLRVYYCDLYSQKLCELITYLCSKMKVKAVFVDYVQLLYRDGNRRERREEIKDICNDLRNTAIKLGIPLVLSAQLNRETASPVDMSEDNIADSADLTRYANTILCLWNSYFENVKNGKETFLSSEEGRKLRQRGFVLGEGGKIYAKITKNRGGTPNIDTVLDFTGDTGFIAPNAKETHTQTSFTEL